MKKLIYLLISTFLSCNGAYAQDTWYRLEQGSGIPANNPTSPSPKTGYVKQDSLTGKWYKWITGSSWKETNLFVGQKGDKGDTGPAGPQGIPGTGGGGASADCLPISYGGKTFAQLGLNQAFIDANYGGMGLNVNDTRDLAELMACEKSGKPIALIEDMGINRGWNIPKTRYFFDFSLKGRTLYSTNSNAFFLIYCDLPTNLSDAEAMANRTFFIRGPGIIKGSRTQEGIRIGAGSGHLFDFLEYENLKVGNHMEFAMETIDNRPRFTRCITGDILDYYRNLPDAPEKSPCNNSTINTPKYWTDQVETTGTCISIYAAQGVVINTPTLQGGNGTSTATYQYGIDFDDMGVGPVKLFTVNNAYEEINGGIVLTGAYIRLKMRDGNFVLNGALGHHPGILLDTKTSGKATNVFINYVSWWKRINGKTFDTTAPSPTSPYGCSYTFYGSKLASEPEGEINTQNFKTAIPQIFVSPSSISYCGDAPNTNCGYGKYTITLPGR